ncbi:hypothetical protein Syun_029603 [Stephania yunnanensis]|uniref:Uncharacterized protein n=1 Tax=Stephania yunnanensis TaxID=152371 RepID=A0AAP0HHF8_9MAGN
MRNRKRCGGSETGGASSAKGARGGAPAASDERSDTIEGRGRTTSAVAMSRQRSAPQKKRATDARQRWRPATRRLRGGPATLKQWRTYNSEAAWGGAVVDWSARKQYQRLRWRRRRLRGKRSRRGERRQRGEERGAGVRRSDGRRREVRE